MEILEERGKESGPGSRTFSVALWGSFIRPPAPFCNSRKQSRAAIPALVTEVRLNPSRLFLLSILRSGTALASFIQCFEGETKWAHRPGQRPPPVEPLWIRGPVTPSLSQKRCWAKTGPSASRAAPPSRSGCEGEESRWDHGQEDAVFGYVRTRPTPGRGHETTFTVISDAPRVIDIITHHEHKGGPP